jgi:Domain of unknown function DUF29
VAPPTRNHDRDFAAWARGQAALLRARDASALDWDHLAAEVKDLWTWAAHALAMLLHACIELAYGGERHEAYLYYWQSAAFYHHQTMLRSAVKDSPNLHTRLADLLPEANADARAERRAKATPPLTGEPPEDCPRTVARRLDCRFWPPESPPRLA